jgi:putative peptidoglycan lipid II flippase
MAAPPASTGGDPSVRVHPGDRVDGRYVVYEQTDENWGVSGWRAHDEVLGRDVLLTTFQPQDPRAPALVEAARGASRVNDHRFVRVLDAQVAEPTGFLVREWVGGRTLADLLGAGPLPEDVAVAITLDVAEAIAAAHAEGLAHLCIDPSSIVVTDDGAVRVKGLGTAKVLRGVQPSSEGAARDDTRGLGRVLYAALTARSATLTPGQQSSEILPTAGGGETPPAPRQVRAGVSPLLDAITVRALGSGRSHRVPAYQSPREVARALARVSRDADAPLPVLSVVGREAGGDVVDALPPPPPPRAARPALDPLPGTTAAPEPLALPPVGGSTGASPPRRTGSRWLRAAGIAAAVALAAGAALLGGQLVAANRTGETAEPSPDGAGSELDPPAPTGGPAAQLQVVSARDFDPLGNGTENPEDTPLALDGDPGTAWLTQTYFDPLERQKDGVGLLLDMGRPVSVGEVDLLLVGQSSDVEALVAPGATTPPAGPDGFVPLASATGAGSEVGLSGTPETTRYVLVWFTRLPAVDGGWRGGVADVRVSG